MSDWTTTKPAAPGVYRVRGFKNGDPKFYAVVEVIGYRSKLVCNLHVNTSDGNVRDWPHVSDCHDQFQWQRVDAAPSPAPDARVLTCVYCGHEYPQDTPAWGDAVLTEHIAQCGKHPMRALEKECDQLRAEASAMLFGPPIPYSTGDELQADTVLAILTLGACTCAAEIVTRESIKRYDGSVSHYCVPTRSLTR